MGVRISQNEYQSPSVFSGVGYLISVQLYISKCTLFIVAYNLYKFFQVTYRIAPSGNIPIPSSNPVCSFQSPGGDPAFGPDNIRVNMVCPSFSDTPIIEKTAPHLSPEDFKEFKASLDFVP